MVDRVKRFRMSKAPGKLGKENVKENMKKSECDDHKCMTSSGQKHIFQSDPLQNVA